jgi:hypothetical protein
VDASAGSSGSSGAPGRDAGFDDTSTRDSGDLDRAVDAGGTEAGDTEAGTCGPTFCFDVFECWFLFPSCGYTACDLFSCKK